MSDYIIYYYAEIYHVRRSCPTHHRQLLWITCFTYCSTCHSCGHRFLFSCYHSNLVCRTEQKESTFKNMYKVIIFHVWIDNLRSVILHNNGIYLTDISEFSGTQNAKFKPSTRSIYNRSDKSSDSQSIGLKPNILLHKLLIIYLLHSLFLHNVLEIEHNIHIPIPKGKCQLTQSIPSLSFTQNTKKFPILLQYIPNVSKICSKKVIFVIFIAGKFYHHCTRSNSSLTVCSNNFVS